MMTIAQQIFRSLHHHSLKLNSNRLHSLHSPPPPTQSIHQSAICTEILTIINSTNPMEEALDHVLPFFNPNVAKFVFREKRHDLKLGLRFFFWTARKEGLGSIVLSRMVEDAILENKGRNFDLYWSTLEEVKEMGNGIGVDAFWVLISGYARIGMAEKAVEAFEKMREFQCVPDANTFNLVMQILFRNEMHWLALAVYKRMEKVHCVPNLWTYNVLIWGLSKAGMVIDALKMLDKMRERGFLPDEGTFSMIVSALCVAEKTSDAKNLFDEMRDSECCKPGLFCGSALVCGLCKVGRVDEAVEVFEALKKDGHLIGIQAYSSLIDCLFKNGRFDEGNCWYEKMLEAGLEPDVVVYGIRLKALSKEGQVREALMLLREMRGSGVVPDLYCYNAVIGGLCDMRLLHEARALQCEMYKTKCFPNTVTYTILIRGMLENGSVKKAQQLFMEMEKVGCLPNVWTYDILIHGLCKMGELDNALHIFYKMGIGSNPSLFLRLGANEVFDNASLQALIEKLCQSGSVLKAYRLLRRLSDTAVPTIVTYNILISGMCKVRDIDRALKLFRDLQINKLLPDSVTYATLIDGLFRVNRHEDAFRIFEQMEKKGLKPSLSIYFTIMTWLSRRLNVSSAVNVWLIYLQTLPNREVDKVKLAKENFETGDVGKAVRLLIEMDLEAKDFSLSPYTIWLIGYCQKGRLEDALTIFNVLKEFQVTLNSSSCVALIRCLCERNNLDLAVDVFIYTLDEGITILPWLYDFLLKSLLYSEDKSEHAFDLLRRMKSKGYNLDEYLYRSTINLLYGHTKKFRGGNAAPG